MDTCPECGATVAREAAACPKCGSDFREQTLSFPPVEAPPASGVRTSGIVDGPVLVVRKGPEVGERFYLEKPRLSVGRDPGNDIFLNDITVSRTHASLEVSGGDVTVVDEGSLNGVYVNGVSIDRSALRNGDQLQVGRFQMVFMSGGGE